VEKSYKKYRNIKYKQPEFYEFYLGILELENIILMLDATDLLQDIFGLCTPPFHSKTGIIFSNFKERII
ncbi:hypothetical protein Anas_09010, partial [Armadillidium nasatum]